MSNTTAIISILNTIMSGSSAKAASHDDGGYAGHFAQSRISGPSTMSHSTKLDYPGYWTFTSCSTIPNKPINLKGTEIKEEEVWTCDYCHKVFDTRNELIRHLNNKFDYAQDLQDCVISQLEDLGVKFFQE